MDVLWKVFLSPGEAFDRVAERPRWWLGLLILVSALLVGNLLATLGTLEDTLAKIAASPQIQQAPWVANPGFIVSTSLVSVLLVSLLGFFIQAVFFHLMVPLAGGEPGFTKTLGVLAWSKMPVALGGLLYGILTLSLHTPVRASLEAFLPEGSPGPVLALLQQVELFSVWSLALLGLGLIRVHGTKREPTILIVAAAWALWLTISAGLGGLGSAMGAP